MNTWRDKTLREKAGRKRRWGFWSKRGNDDASTPTESFWQQNGEWDAGKSICRDWRSRTLGVGCGKALQWKGRDRRVLCAKRDWRVDLTNGKMVLAFPSVCRITADLKSTPSASPNTEENLQMEKSEVRLQYEKKKKKGSYRQLTTCCFCEI